MRRYPGSRGYRHGPYRGQKRPAGGDVRRGGVFVGRSNPRTNGTWFPLSPSSPDILGYRFPSLDISRHLVISWPMVTKSPRFVFDIGEADRALLEAHRVRLGLRSHAETLRVLIRRVSPWPFEHLVGVGESGGGGSGGVLTKPSVWTDPPTPAEREIAGRDIVRFGPERSKPGSRLKAKK